MKPWAWIPDISAPMPFHMALDSLLFDQAGGLSTAAHACLPSVPWIRFYQASIPGITVGYSYPEHLEENENTYCRRVTGGGRVFHGKDLLFSMVASRDQHEMFRNVRSSYQLIHECVKKAFERCRVRTKLEDSSVPAGRGGDCFAEPIGHDVLFGGRKVAGGAQKRRKGYFLHQESVFYQGFCHYEEMREAILRCLGETMGSRFIKIQLDPGWLHAARSVRKIPGGILSLK